MIQQTSPTCKDPAKKLSTGMERWDKATAVSVDHGKKGDLLIKMNTILSKKLSRTAEKLIEELKGEGSLG